MKNKFLIGLIFTLISASTFGQLNGNFKSVRWTPPQDTATFLPRPIGTVVLSSADTLFYYVGADSLWHPFGGGGGGGNVNFANNGLSLSGDTVQLGGTLLYNTIVSGDKNFELNTISNKIEFNSKNFKLKTDIDPGLSGWYQNMILNSPDSTKFYNLTAQDSGAVVSTYQNNTTGSQLQIGSEGIIRTNLGMYIRPGGDIGTNGQVLTSDGSGAASWENPGGGSTFANNGLTMSGDTVQLGGTLTKNTEIFLDSIYSMSFSSSFLNGNQSSLSINPGGSEYIRLQGYKPNESYNEIYVDPSYIFVNTTGGYFQLNTDIANGSGIERMKIDSVGDFTFAGKYYDIYSDGDIIDIYSLDQQLGQIKIDTSSVLITANDNAGKFTSIEMAPNEIVNTANDFIKFFPVSSGQGANISFGYGVNINNANTIGNLLAVTYGDSVENNSLAELRLNAVNDAPYYYLAVTDPDFASTSSMYLDSAYIQLLTPEMFMSINGDFGSAGEYLGSDGANGVVWGTPSDLKLKKDITPLKDARKKLLQLKPVNFTYKKNNQKTVGFIAQDVQKVLPEMVTDKRGTLHLKNTTYLEPYIIATIQEMQKELTALRKEVKELRGGKDHKPRYDRRKK